MTAAVQFNKVTKRYGSHTVLDEFTLAIPKGAIFALVGRNEAGKTTALRILLGLARATSGSITLSGENTPVRVGYLPEEPAQYDWMTARQYLRLSAALARISSHEVEDAIDQLLTYAHLSDNDSRIRDFSLEEKVQLGLAHALVGDPELLVLDEPTSALDPVGQYEVLDMIETLRGRTTILLCTHILEDAVHVADTIGIIEAGRLVISGSRRELWEWANLPRQIEIEVTANLTGVMSALSNEAWVESVEIRRETLVLFTHDYSEAWERIPNIVLAQKVGLKRLELIEPSYDDVFISLVGGDS